MIANIIYMSVLTWWFNETPCCCLHLCKSWFLLNTCIDVKWLLNREVVKTYTRTVAVWQWCEVWLFVTSELVTKLRPAGKENYSMRHEKRSFASMALGKFITHHPKIKKRTHIIVKQQQLVFLKTSGYFCGFSLNLDTSKHTSRPFQEDPCVCVNTSSCLL